MNKVLFISHLSPTTNNSATENYNVECISAFQRSGNNVIITNYSLAHRLRQLDKNHFSFAGLFKGKPHLISILNTFIFLILLKLRKEKVTVVSYNISKKYLLIYKLAKKLNFKVTFWLLDYYPERDFFYKYCLDKYAEKAVCINKHIHEVSSKYCPSEIFYGGYSGKVYKSINIRNTGTLTKNIVYAGTLNKLNGVDLMIELISKTELKLTLDIFGDGEYRNKVKAASQNSKKITYHGLVTKNVVLEKLRQADFLPLPRRANNNYYKWFFPSKIIEMIAMPGVTICSKMTGVTDIIKDVAILENITTWQDLEAAIVSSMEVTPEKLLIKETKRKELFKTTFNWDLLPSKLIDFDE